MSGSGSIPCGICREYFMDTEMLRKHLRNHVSENPLPDDTTMDGLGISASGPFPCGICREEFMDTEMLRKHIRDHISGNLYHLKRPWTNRGYQSQSLPCGNSWAQKS